MAIIRLIEQTVDFHTDQGILVRAVRSCVELELVTADGSTVGRLALVDSGAPLSVLPYTLWHEQGIAWQALGNTLFRDDKPDPAALTWRGIPCQLGETQVRIVDWAKEVRSSPLRLRAKLPLRKGASNWESQTILGFDFLVANATTLTLRGGARGLDGVLLVD
jgi:hypothetical protein